MDSSEPFALESSTNTGFTAQLFLIVANTPVLYTIMTGAQVSLIRFGTQFHHVAQYIQPGAYLLIKNLLQKIFGNLNFFFKIMKY